MGGRGPRPVLARPAESLIRPLFAPVAAPEGDRAARLLARALLEHAIGALADLLALIGGRGGLIRPGFGRADPGLQAGNLASETIEVFHRGRLTRAQHRERTGDREAKIEASHSHQEFPFAVAPPEAFTVVGGHLPAAGMCSRKRRDGKQKESGKDTNAR